jgi:hypothetical protein
VNAEQRAAEERERQSETDPASVSECLDRIESESKSIQSLFSELERKHGDQAQRETRGINTRIEIQPNELRRLKELIRSEPPLDPLFSFVPRSAPLNEGILAFLSQQCGGDVHVQDCVWIFSDSCQPPVEAHNVAGLCWCSDFMSLNWEDQSIGFDFKDKRILPTHITIRSSLRAHVILRCWVIEVMNDPSDEYS